MKYTLAIFAALAILFASCSAQINGQLVQDGSGTVRLQANLEPNMVALIRNFSSLGGAAPAGPILNAESLNRSLRTAPGIASSALRNSSQERIEGTIGISRIGDLLSSGDSHFIRYEAPTASAPGRLSIHLDRSLGPRIIPLVSPDAMDYLTALMAPIATGEALRKAEYLTLVQSVYGRPISGEIATSKISIVLTLPGQIQSVRGGTYSGQEARFEVHLADILVLETPLEYELTWR
jgi:hypothetical protein